MRREEAGTEPLDGDGDGDGDRAGVIRPPKLL
jgi:hypothetical protein